MILNCELLVFQGTSYGVILRHLKGGGPGRSSKVIVGGSILPFQSNDSEDTPSLEERLKVSSLIESRLLPFETLISIHDLIRIQAADGSIVEILAEVVPRGRFHGVG